jgi:hypothetical protein
LPLVLAYHGCDLKTAQELLGGSPFLPSKKDYDWLGAGIYFWENDVVRAYQWATEARRSFEHPSVVGAVIELGNCLDLTTQSGIDAVRLAYKVFIGMVSMLGDTLPENVDPVRGASGDKAMRRLDCAVMNCLFETQQTVQDLDPVSQQFGTQPYTTVRALFPEGTKLYPGAGFWDKTHIQICVREPEQILGVFRIPEWQRIELELPSLYSADSEL